MNGSEAPNSESDRVLDALRAMDERVLHKRVIMPVLKQKGATHVRYVHGAFERGKDIVYVYRDFDDDLCLRVCQVKNEKLTGSTSSPSSAMGVLRQLEQCRDTAVLNPVTNTKELPQEVALYTTYPIPDHAVADGAAFLERLRATRCKVLGPEALLSQIGKYLPQLYGELAIPGSSLSRAMERYVVVHREADAFDLEPTRHLADIFVNLGMAPGSAILKTLLSGAATPKSPHSAEIPLEVYNNLYEMHANLQADFPPAELLERASGELEKRVRKDAGRTGEQRSRGSSDPARKGRRGRLDHVSLNTVRFSEFFVGTARYTREVRRRAHSARVRGGTPESSQRCHSVAQRVFLSDGRTCGSLWRLGDLLRGKLRRRRSGVSCIAHGGSSNST